MLTPMQMKPQSLNQLNLDLQVRFSYALNNDTATDNAIPTNTAPKSRGIRISLIILCC